MSSKTLDNLTGRWKFGLFLILALSIPRFILVLQANEIGNPKAVRAVANANGHNRIAIIIPCHRVIGSDGSLTGYGGGLERKKWLLDFEQNNLKKI